MDRNQLRFIYEPDSNQSIGDRVEFLNDEGVSVYSFERCPCNTSFREGEDIDTRLATRLLDKVKTKFPEHEDKLSFTPSSPVYFLGGIEKIIGVVCKSDRGLLYQDVLDYSKYFGFSNSQDTPLNENGSCLVKGELHLIVEYPNIFSFFAIPSKEHYDRLIVKN